ncbi:MAG: PilZ domain-containing protein [Porphyrobacter sp.]|nr:PilZ domain-containing protein [Porphyrobacter sp.]
MLESLTLQSRRRAHSRLRLGISAHLQTLDGRRKIRLIDLSQGGARIVLGEPLDTRQGVLKWFHFEAFGTVVWREGKHLGIGFDEALPLSVLIETRQWAPTVVREDAIRARKAAREWVTGNHRAGIER